jgi:hypothetical protein
MDTMAQRPHTIIDLTGMLKLGVDTKSLTIIALDAGLAQEIIDKFALLGNIEAKLRATPVGALLLDAEIAGAAGKEELPPCTGHLVHDEYTRCPRHDP